MEACDRIALGCKADHSEPQANVAIWQQTMIFSNFAGTSYEGNGSPPRKLESWSGRAMRSAHQRQLLPSLIGGSFWSLLYLLMSVRASLADDVPFEFISMRRLVTTLVGTALFCLTLHSLKRLQLRSLSHRLAVTAVSGCLASLTLAATRLIYGRLSAPAIGPSLVLPADSARWALVWFGYFLACVFLYFLVQAEWSGRFAGLVEDEPEPKQITAIQGKVADLGASISREGVWADRGRQHVQVAIDQIQWVEADRDYLKIHDASGVAIVRMTMASMEQKLDPALFARVHRSAICRIGAIESLEKRTTGAWVALLSEGRCVPVSRTFASRFRSDPRMPVTNF